jgi:hypothetical protein
MQLALSHATGVKVLAADTCDTNPVASVRSERERERERDWLPTHHT